MTKETKSLILYRLERAHEALHEAEILFEQNHTNTYVNRLYYACFYTVSALLLTEDLSSAKHSGIRALFHKNFLNTGSIEMELGQFYDKLFRNRQKGDYADFIYFKVDEVRPWFEETKQFVESIESIIKKKI
jgi:uncharacterized protein (UPF0332 family)